MIYAHRKVVTVHTEKTEVQATGETFTTDETRYLHYDSLGSVDAITNQQGTVVQRTAYKPFGEKIDIQKLSKGKEVTTSYLTEQFITTFLHEPIHNGDILGSRHTDAFYRRVNQEVRNFYDSYPSIEYRNHPNRIPSGTASIRIYF